MADRRYKTLFIDEELHRRVKLHATLLDESIKEYVERALTVRLQAESDGPEFFGMKRLIDTRTEYTAERSE